MNEARTDGPLHSWEKVLAGIVALLTIPLVLGGMTRALQARSTPRAVPLLISKEELLAGRTGFAGEKSAPYTLIEFADYQCPPCRAADKNVRTLLGGYHGKVRLLFRNFPLSKIHPNAMAAAKTAEVAREQGRFWRVHDALYEHQEDLSAAALRSIAMTEGIEAARHSRACTSSAQKAVKEDIALAVELGLNSTPSFVLCCPDGRVIQLGALTQLRDFVSP